MDAVVGLGGHGSPTPIRRSSNARRVLDQIATAEPPQWIDLLAIARRG